jgi:hypothetical protein
VRNLLKLADALARWKPAEHDATREPILLLEAGWEEIVGSEVAQNSQPVRVADGTLTIATRSSAWSHQLSFLGDHVLRAVAARIPEAKIRQLQFRVGRLRERRTSPIRRRVADRRVPGDRPNSASAADALERFRFDVEQRRNERRRQGWEECPGCGALVGPAAATTYCQGCAAARERELTAATARLLFEAPWLGYAGTAALVDGLKEEEYERIRGLLLRHWWGTLAQARTAKRLSRDDRERHVASSYVLLKSKLPPEQIMPATVRSILGDELHDLLYGAP